MKKHLLLFVLALAAAIVQAQNGEMYSIMYHDMLEEDLTLCFIQQRDGDFVMNNSLYDNNYNPLGTMFYRISHATNTVTDSLFVADTAPVILIASDPRGEGNILASLEYHEDCDSTFLRICRFPEDGFNVNHDEDIVVAACDGLVFDAGGMVDSKGDVVMMYFKEKPGVGAFDVSLARFGSDGELKHQSLLFEDNMNGVSSLKQLGESPLQYYVWKTLSGQHPSNLLFYTIDSLFNKNMTSIHLLLSEEIIDPDYPFFTEREYLSVNGDTEVIPAGGDDILVAAQYVHDTVTQSLTAEYGVAVAKFDTRTAQLKDYVVFNDYPDYYNLNQCLGIKQMSDGTVYFLYREEGHPKESFVAVKMDSDLNVDWKRFCKTNNIVIQALNSSFNYSPLLYKDGNGEEQGVVWTGYGKKTDGDEAGFLCLFLSHDGPAGLEKYGMEVRPYTFYPNPAKDRIRFQFSPDVQPKQIDLHDLQGRLVRTQSGSLESIDLGRLPAGTYMLRVTMEDGTTYSDKVVKE